MNFEAIKKAAEGYKADMVRFLRAMISHPSESCEEKEVVACIRVEPASAIGPHERSSTVTHGFSIASRERTMRCASNSAARAAARRI